MRTRLLAYRRRTWRPPRRRISRRPAPTAALAALWSRCGILPRSPRTAALFAALALFQRVTGPW